MPCQAQTERYELGKRLRRFEEQWQQAAGAQRVASTEPMQKAVQSFFGLQLAKAGKWLDEAYFAARSPEPPDEFVRAMIAHRLDMRPACIELSDPALQLKLAPFYEIKVATSETKTTQPNSNSSASDLVKAFQIEAKIVDDRDQPLDTRQLAADQLLQGWQWKLANVPEGDYFVKLSARRGDEVVNLPPVQVSFVSAADKRLQKLDTWLKQSGTTQERSDNAETVRLTVRQYAQTIRSLLAQRPLETDYPAARLMQLAEALVETPADAARLFQQAAQTSAWMTIHHQRQSLPVRVYLPPHESNSQKPRPVVFAFHGAGGSENMFFETYGAGRIIELARQRGWMIVAPRHPLLGMPLSYREMLETLCQFYPIDTQQIYLVGHSMGGAEVTRQVSLSPQSPQAVAVIGGGGNAKDVEPVKAAPWLVAAGELDFGRSSAKSLAARLKQLNCQVEYREYPAIEHMVIVQAALDDVFTFLQNSKK